MTEDRHPSGAPWRNFYGRFRGKTIRASQKDYLENDLDALSPGPISWDVNPDRVRIDPAGIFDGKDIWLEIGFGGGEHLVAMSERYPEIGLIGCEPFINGVAMLLGKIRKANVENLKVHPGDVRDLFDVMPDAAISKAFLNYPDPWPKSRHHRRRFVTAEHLDPLFRVLKPGAEFRVATDIPDYVRQTLEEVPKTGFVLETAMPNGMSVAWDDWVSTRYEQKALREGRDPHYLTFRKPA
jgi:tRNA (guanine-N7-)-methyltransferase